MGLFTNSRRAGALSVLALLAALFAFASPAAATIAGVPADCSGYLETLTPTHVGDDGPNTIFGTQGDDIIFGYGGNDHILGRGGDDIICGGDGDDRVEGGSGSDQVYGGNDVDRVYGRAGDDFLFGNDGNDYMAGANGNDHMYGGAGNDRMFGQNGNDHIDGGTGDDTLNGGRQYDTVDGGTPAPGTTERNRCVDTEDETNCGTVTTPPPVELQILAINDFHGNIATSSSSFGGTGRADFLATNIAAAEADADHSIFVSAGDLIGASPLISALFHDEPTIEAMNLMGLDINAVGNHEFDEGPDELLRMANGGSHPIDGDLDGTPFGGAEFEFLAANVVVDDTGETIFAPYTIKTYEGVKVAFIGMTLEGTPSIVTPSGVAGLTFNDEVATVNALIPELQEQEVEAIVVLLHEGGQSEGGQNDCGDGLTGPIADITAALDDAVDLVIAGHTNDEFICEIDGKWVTMADNRGRLFTDIDVTLDRDTNEMTIVAINNVPNLQDVTPDPTLTALIDKYDALSAPLANEVIGTTTTDISRTPNAAGESALGDVIADAQLAATASAATGDADVAFMNPGGIRADIDFVSVGTEADGALTFGEAFGVQPFGNSLVTMTLTGEQIDLLLEQQWVGQTDPRILQVSEGFTYQWDPAAADGSRVDPASIMIDGVVIDAAASYRVTVNSFLSDGGDNFAVLVDGTDRLGGEVDLDALVTYFGANSPVAPGPQDRIATVPTPA